MKTKTKLNLGVGSLFILIILLSLVSVYNINALKSDSDNILKANYNSLLYCRNILTDIEHISVYNLKNIEDNIKKQEANITEQGEEKATKQLRLNLNALKENQKDSSLYKKIKLDLYQIMELNMQAIQRKSTIAQSTADNAVFWIVFTGSSCFLIAFVLLINLPASIANPIKELSESIKQIANKNYSERVSFEGHSEFKELANSFNTMAEKLEEYNNSNLAKLMMAMKRTETIIDNIHDPVIGLDENLMIIFANEQASKICGINKQNMIGSLVIDLASKNDLINNLIKDLMIGELPKSKKVTPIKIINDNKENYYEKETIHISITPTGEKSKRLVGHVILLRNVTVYKEMDAAKTNFIATVSHEFKTPISSIKMSLNLLENKKIGTLNQEQEQLVTSINDDINRLLKITGELLNMTQAESGNIQLSIIPTDPIEFINYSINANKTSAEQKNILIKSELPMNIYKVMADGEKSAWVLTNLISNAIRYSHENSEIVIQMTNETDKVKISVTDKGQGIATKHKEKIFDRYYRVPGSKKEGTGLGLSISKEFMEAQGGSISVNTELGIGSTFEITFNISLLV